VLRARNQRRAVPDLLSARQAAGRGDGQITGAGADGEAGDAGADDGDLTRLDWDIPDLEDDNESVKQKKSLQRLRRLLAYFNKRYACVNEAGKFWIFEQRHDALLRRDVLDHIKRGDFCLFYENRRLVVWNKEKEKYFTATWAEWWLKSVKRRQYDGVTLDPTRKHSPGLWNLWRGYGVTPVPGDWSLMRQHIEGVICSGVAAWSEYLLNWIAYMLQHPERPGEVAVVLRGDEGIGKGILGRTLVRLFGTHGLQITDAGHLVGRFNEHLKNLVFLLADEAFFVGDKKHEGRLKALITEPQMTIEGKYKTVVMVRNYLHLLLSSNNDWVIPAALRARRWFPLQVPDTHMRDIPYFTAIARQLRNGGLAGMLYDLLRRDLSAFDVRTVPLTDELQTQKALSLPSLERWWLAVLSRGFLWRSRHGAPWFRDWHDFYTTELLMRSYLQWCDENRPFERKSREQLGIFFREIYSWSRPRVDHPVHEIDSIDRHAVDVITQLGGTVVTVPKPLDEIAIVVKGDQPGYRVETLDEARARFLECRDITSPPWQEPK
jgi:hypothetical protein